MSSDTTKSRPKYYVDKIRGMRKPVDLDVLNRMIDNTIEKQVRLLTAKAKKNELFSRDESNALVNYKKLVMDLQEQQHERAKEEAQKPTENI